jgi:hypothetical protein
MTTLTDIPRKTTRGTAFLIEESAPQEIFTPEDLSEEHLAVGKMVDEFWANEVEPNLPAIREKKPGVAMAVLRKSVDLGLTAMATKPKWQTRKSSSFWGRMLAEGRARKQEG